MEARYLGSREVCDDDGQPLFTSHTIRLAGSYEEVSELTEALAGKPKQPRPILDILNRRGERRCG